APARGTASSTWSRRRCHPPAGARAPGRTSPAEAPFRSRSAPPAQLCPSRPGAAAMARVRVRFSKVGKIRWTSHRDVARMWERAFRRVGLPLAYTSGFSPRPKVSFGLALSTGYESVAEYLDLNLDERDHPPATHLPEVLSAALPEGVDAMVAAEIDPRAP